ncbi:hypothetical protein [Siphonobacter sp. SORGH_AS_0500]|uniref:hypothetical protein n=1 Tax=Siphonobacter sp. SORGH_AS_0500 TaxID=1864824 RepID=UPI0028568D0D|nr:hypothetical protein [Siphonobacter sp. SORGH_AS_0500]MDR6197258.1 hypothetical protein [Siphonobacter sp. SORGH_AS_0500]
MKSTLTLLILSMLTMPLVWAQSSERQVKAFLLEYQQQVNRLSQCKQESEVMNAKRFFANDTLRIPAMLLPTALYRVSRSQISVHDWMQALPSFFWEGFTYKLDTAHCHFEELTQDKNQIWAKVTVPVVLHGLSLKTHQRHYYQEEQEILLSAERQGTPRWQIEKMTGTGRGMKETPLNAQQLLDLNQFLQSSLIQLMYEKTPATVREQLLEKLQSYVTLDAKVFACKKTSGSSLSLREISQLNLTAEQAAACRVEGFDLVYQGNFFQDRSGNWQADMITLKGISVWMDGKVNYQDRQMNTLPAEPPFQEKIQLTHLAFLL